MCAIVFHPSLRRVSHLGARFSLPLLVGCAVLPMLSGCSQGRFFSPLAGRPTMDNSPPGMHGPSIAGPASMRKSRQRVDRDSQSQVQVTSEDATPETGIEPVEQRLTPTHSHASPAMQHVSHRTDIQNRKERASGSHQLDPQTRARQAAIDASLQPDSKSKKKNTSGVAPVSHVASFSSDEDGTTLELPEGYDGVDVSSLMRALQDAPPEVQKAAIARLVAMSRRRAKATAQPQSIEAALAATFDSLPNLPDEVVDRGVSPTRIGNSAPDAIDAVATASHTVFTDQVDDEASEPIAATWAGGEAAASRSESPRKKSLAPAPATSSEDEKVSTASIQAPIADPGRAAKNSTESLSPNTDPATRLSDAELFDALVERLQTEVEGESEADRHRRQIVARHLMVLAGEPDRAVDNLQGLSTQEQEYLRHQLLGLWTIIDPQGHPVPSRRFSSALPEIRKATGFLAAASDSLEVRGLEFCTEIESYGQIKPFPNRRFTAGQEIILYCEIDNFISESVDKGFETRLQGSYDLLDANGKRVSSQTLPEDHQVTKNRLRDYFIAYQMYLPDSIQPGDYQLRLTMEDVHGKKYGQSIVDFQIKR